MANGQGARKELYEQLDKVILQWKDEPGGLLPIMQNAQEILGCVDEEVQHYISERSAFPYPRFTALRRFTPSLRCSRKGSMRLASAWAQPAMSGDPSL